MKIVFKLSQKARKSGGDKYVSEKDETFCIYFPQYISRLNNECRSTIEIDIDI